MGWRYVTPVTTIPHRSLEVWAAMAASNVYPSKQVPSGSVKIGMKWSKTEAQSRPSSSAFRHMAR